MLYIDNMLVFLKSIFHVTIIALIILSLYPGSLLGLIFFSDPGLQPTLIKNPFGSTINHFIAYLYASCMGFFLYFKNKKFINLVYLMFFLSVVLECFHLIIPNRSFQFSDLIGNILGVLMAYFIIKIYLSFKKS